jgi:hypothetical protein
MDKYRYVFKERNTGKFIDKVFTLEHIEKGQASSEIFRLRSEYDLISRDRWTGLVSENEMDIYDNSLLLDDMSGLKYKVFWCNEEARWKARNDRERYNVTLNDHSCLVFKVIGTIHDKEDSNGH